MRPSIEEASWFRPRLVPAAPCQACNTLTKGRPRHHEHREDYGAHHGLGADDGIEVVLGEGTHSVRCHLAPTRNGLAYAGSAMGREIVYERARADVKADLERANLGSGSFKGR